MSISSVNKLLLYPANKGLVPAIKDDQKLLFINGVYDHEFHGLNLKNIDFLQFNLSNHAPVELKNSHIYNDFSDIKVGYDCVLIQISKQKEETRYLMANALELLKNDGLMICAGLNDEGGKKILKDFKRLYSGSINEHSKYKGRVVFLKKEEQKINRSVQKIWLDEGRMRWFEDINYYSQPGIFGWNKVDKGSALLIGEINTSLEGVGADFGCGYGYLACNILREHQKINQLFCIDIDVRALRAAEKNIEALKQEAKIFYIQDDLTNPGKIDKGFDFIVMNPPFHIGKKQDTNIGNDFIKTAAKYLRKKGELWMVANNHLPYENLLFSRFSSIDKVCEKEGYKIYCAVK
jgi:16S rRNA (guanine1207-N2)-methyltransferase